MGRQSLPKAPMTQGKEIQCLIAYQSSICISKNKAQFLWWTGRYGTTVTYAFLFVDDDTDLYNTAYAYNTGRNCSIFKMTLLLMSASNGVVNSSRLLL